MIPFKKRVLIALSLLLAKPFSLISLPHFYHANNGITEPITYRDKYHSIAVSLNGGGTKTGRSGDGEKTSLLNIYGTHNIHQVAGNIDLAKTNTTLLAAFNGGVVPPSAEALEKFAHLKFSGKLNYFNIDLSGLHYLDKHFFVQWSAPFNHIRIDTITYEDLTLPDSPATNGYNLNENRWINVKTVLSDEMSFNDLSIGNASRFGLGDIVCSLGFSYTPNFIHSFNDSIFVSAKVGLVLPTSHKRNLKKAFSIPSGYNGHTGVPVELNGMINIKDIVKIGGTISEILFFNSITEMRLKTFRGNGTRNLDQQGSFIKFGKGFVIRDLGNIFHTDAFIKIGSHHDNCIIGYSYTKQSKTRLNPHRTQTNSLFSPTGNVPFSLETINSDDMLGEWNMHVLHFGCEYRTVRKNQTDGIHVKIIYNHPFKGKRIFSTSTAGGSLSASLLWNF